MNAITAFLTENWKGIAGILAAIVGGGLVLKWRSPRLSGNSNNVDQSRASAKGDIVGRDKK